MYPNFDIINPVDILDTLQQFNNNMNMFETQESIFQSDQEFYVHSQTEKTKMIKKAHQSQKLQPYRCKWTSKETKTYIRFVKDNKRAFTCSAQRRKTKYFERMAKKIQTRTPNQCKSHHQKLTKKFGENFQLFLQEVEKMVTKSTNYKENSQKFNSTITQPSSSNEFEFSASIQNAEPQRLHEEKDLVGEAQTNQMLTIQAEELFISSQSLEENQPELQNINQENYQSFFMKITEQPQDFYCSVFYSQ